MSECIDKNKLIKYLQNEGILKKEYGLNRVPKIKMKHGSCCCCACCGQYHEECVCEHNEWLEMLEGFTLNN